MRQVLRATGLILRACNFVAGALTVVLALLICADVLGRLLFSVPLMGVPEITKVGIVCIVWLQIGYTLRSDKHLRSETLLVMMPRQMRGAIGVLNALLGVALLGAIAHYGWGQFLKSWAAGTFEGERPVRIPVWPIWLTVTMGAALTALEYALQIGRDVGLIAPDTREAG